MSIKSDNLIEVSDLKAGQRVIEVDGKWVVVGVGGKTAPTGSGSSGIYMDIYKCVAVRENIEHYGYIVEGAGTSECNGTYTYTDKEATHDIYTNENGCIIREIWDDPDGSRVHLSGLRIFESEDLLKYYYSFAVTEGNYGDAQVIDGAEPAPSVKKFEAQEASWDGHRYNPDTKGFDEELTEGLRYGKAAPTVGNCYNADVSIAINFLEIKDGLLFRLKCESATAYDETGMSQMTYSDVTFKEKGGRKAMHCSGSSGGAVGIAKTVKFPTGDSPFTLCGWVYASYASGRSGGFGYGTDLSNSAMFHLYNNTVEYNAGTSGINEYTTNIPSYEWFFVCYTYDGNGKYRYYYDGNEVESEDATADLLDTTEFKIYTTYLTPSLHASMYYSDIRLYGKCLSADEIQDIYHGNA